MTQRLESQRRETRVSGTVERAKVAVEYSELHFKPRRLKIRVNMVL